MGLEERGWPEERMGLEEVAGARRKCGAGGREARRRVWLEGRVGLEEKGWRGGASRL